MHPAEKGRRPASAPRVRPNPTFMMRFFVYQLGLYGVWCASILGALWGLPALGPAAAIPWLGWHLRRTSRPSSEGALVLASGAFGVAADLVLIHMGGVRYPGLPDGALLGPTWIAVLWMVFATTVKVTLRWLQERMLLAATVGVVGGTGSYLGGRRLGVVDFDLSHPETMLALAVVWGLGVPLLLHLGPWLDEGLERFRSRAALSGASTRSTFCRSNARGARSKVAPASR